MSKKKENKEKKKEKKRISVNKRRIRNKEARAISRNKRNETRRGIKTNFYDFRFNPTSHIYIVLDETENTETVLLQKYKMASVEGGVILALPALTDDMIYNYVSKIPQDDPDSTSPTIYDDKLLRDLIRYYYSVEPGEIINQDKVIFVTGCKKISKNSNLLEATVQPYKGIKWFEGEDTTIHGYKIYNGNRLRKFIKISWHDLDKVYMFQDTLSEFAIYKSIRKKIDFSDYLSDFQAYARRGAADLLWKGIGFNPNQYNNSNQVKEITLNIESQDQDDVEK